MVLSKIEFLIYLIHIYKIKAKNQHTGLRQSPYQRSWQKSPSFPFKNGKAAVILLDRPHRFSYNATKFGYMAAI